MRVAGERDGFSVASPKRRQWAIALAASTLLAACATPDLPVQRASTGPRPSPSQWTGRFSAVYTLPGVPGDEQSAAGRFHLQVQAGHVQFELSTPTGQTIARASVDENGARLFDNQGKLYRAASAEALTEQLFGWRIPIMALPQWLQGRIAEPDDPREGARVLAGTESGWRIRIDSWLDEGLVRIMELNWPAPGAPAERRMRLRLVVDSAS